MIFASHDWTKVFSAPRMWEATPSANFSFSPSITGIYTVIVYNTQAALSFDFNVQQVGCEDSLTLCYLVLSSKARFRSDLCTTAS